MKPYLPFLYITLFGSPALYAAGPRPAAPARTAPSRRAFAIVRSAPRALAPAAANAASRTATKGTVSPDRKRLTFSQRAIRLVVQTGPHNDMLSYRIQGLRNPTLVVPAGSTLRVLYVNTDDDMKHNLRFSAERPPFPSRPDPRQSVGTRDLAPQGSSAQAEDVTVRVPSARGTYTYLCTVMGHAIGGMYGTLVVR